MIALLRTTLAVALLAAPAWAGDGVYEINQACVATGCFPGDGPGFPVTVGSDQSARLTSDLVVPGATTNAIQLGTHTTLDLGGFAIRGPVTCAGAVLAVCPATAGSGIGLGVSGGSGATIRNGTIRGMGGVGIRGADGTLVDGVTLFENAGGGIQGTDAGGWIVRNSKISRNGSFGIALTAAGGHSIIQNNVITGNETEGIGASNTLALDNVITSNGDLGMQLGYSGTDSGYGGNVLSFNNGGTASQINSGNALRPNICGTDAVCP